jgi:hypothetical protein
METRKYLFETKWKQFLTEQAVKFPFEIEVTSANTELYNFLKANPGTDGSGEWYITRKGSSPQDDVKGIIRLILNNYSTGATSSIIPFKIPSLENLGTTLSFPKIGLYTYANNKLILTLGTPSGVKNRKI